MARMKTNCKLYWASFLKLNYCVFEKWPKISHTFVFPLISLQASCQEHSGGGAGKGRRACYCTSRIWISASKKLMRNSHGAPCQLSCQILANQREAETSTNVNKHWKTCVKGDDIITYVISTLQHFASTFSMQIFKFQRRSFKLQYNTNTTLLPFPAPPPKHPGEFVPLLPFNRTIWYLPFIALGQEKRWLQVP